MSFELYDIVRIVQSKDSDSNLAYNGCKGLLTQLEKNKMLKVHVLYQCSTFYFPEELEKSTADPIQVRGFLFSLKNALQADYTTPFTIDIGIDSFTISKDGYYDLKWDLSDWEGSQDQIKATFSAMIYAYKSPDTVLDVMNEKL